MFQASPEIAKRALKKLVSDTQAAGLIGTVPAKRLRGAIARGDLTLDLSLLRPARMPMPSDANRVRKPRLPS